jgi:hypothetical protein
MSFKDTKLNIKKQVFRLNWNLPQFHEIVKGSTECQYVAWMLHAISTRMKYLVKIAFFGNLLETFLSCRYHM